jgi:Spy/CpxP family protein refolding chaperone
MKRFVKFIIIGILVFAPAGAMAQDTLGALILELNLSQDQISQVRWFFNQFAQKQGRLPTAVDVALDHRAEIREVITSPSFNPSKAQQVAKQISAIAAQRMVNRLQLRNQIFHVLTQQQQEHYMKIVQQSLEGLE